MKTLTYYLICLFTIFSINAQTIGQIEKTDCFLDNCDFVTDYPNVEFGYVVVPEDYTKPDNRTLKIAFAIIKATAPNPKPDPIIQFQGGWGLPMLGLGLENYTKRFPLKDRDVIMFDYRGSGFSEPKLCDWLGEEGWNDIASDLTNSEFDRRQVARINKCLDSLEQLKIDINQYGSNNKAKDAVVLAEALGYESYNLFGISYGTRTIQNFIRAADSSNIKIRSAILDSNVAIGNNNHSMTQVYASILKNVFDDCKNDPNCNETFPNLETRYLTFIESLEKDPFVLNFNSKTFTFNAQEVNAVLHQMLYDYRNYKDFPIFVEHFINRDSKAFINLMPRFESLVNDGYNALGAINFVYDWSLLKQEAKLKFKDAAENYRSFEVLDGYKEFYLTEERIVIDSLENTPIASDIPALFAAGTYDPITPPKWTKKVAEGFSNHFYYEAKKIGHGVLVSKCGVELMKDFLDNPLQKPNSECFDALGENDIQFRTNYYKNNRISYIANKLTFSPNILLIISVLLIVLICGVNIILYIISLAKKKANKGVWFFLTSILILLFLGSLYYFIQTSYAQNSILILFGLVKSANMIFFLVPMIFLLSIIAISKWLKNKQNNILNGLSTFSFILFFIIIISFRLFPNF